MKKIAVMIVVFLFYKNQEELYMMNFKDFCNQVEKNISNYLPPRYQGAQVRIQKNRKVNLGDLAGVSVTMPGQPVGPVIYLNNYYRDVAKGNMTMSQVFEGIAREGAESLDRLKGTEIGGFDPSMLSVWSAMKDRVYLSAVGLTRNKELLATVPHREMGDIACTYRIHLKGPDGSDGTILVNNQMMDTYHVNEEQIFQAAVENTLKNTPPTLNRMSVVTSCMMMQQSGHREETKERLLDNNLLDVDSLRKGEPEEQNQSSRDEETRSESHDQISLDDDLPLFVLTISSMTMGAAVVFVPNVLEQIQQKMPDGFFVLPSSIHEVMIVPKGLGSDPCQLDEMVSSINEEQVDQEEQLSDLCHEYDADRKTLICPTAPELNKVKNEEPDLKAEMSL